MEVCFQTTTDLFIYFWWSNLSYSFPLVPGTTSVEEKKLNFAKEKRPVLCVRQGGSSGFWSAV